MAEAVGGSSWRHPRLGRRFHLLFGASVISNVGDGLAFTAFPLMASRLTGDAFTISLVTAAGTLPFVVVGLVSGVLVDRADRRSVMVVTDGLRALAVAGLAAAILAPHISVAGLILAAAAIGVGAAIFTVASQALVPALVSGERSILARANGRFYGSEVFGVQFAGPAIGGAIFAASHSLPFSLDAGSFALSALLVALISGRYRVPEEDRREPVARAARAGVRYVAHDRLLRTYTLTVAAANLVLAAQEAVLVVLAERRLGLGPTGYGLLFASLAVGGFAATLAGTPLSRRFHEGALIRTGFALLPVGAVLAGAAPDPAVCGLGLALTAFGVMTVNVAAGPLRQAVIPPELLGRVFAASLMLGRGALPIGAVIGGALAAWQPRAPFLASAVLMAVAVVVTAGGLSPRAIDAARAAADRDRGAATGP